MDQIRELEFYKDHFTWFYDRQPAKVRTKIDYVLFIVTHVKRIPEKFLKHIEGEARLYEIRVEVGNNIFRIFCCFDEGNLVVLFNGFQKKSQKTPRGEIEMAVKLMNEYFAIK